MSGQIGDNAPDFTLASPNDGDITLSTYRGTNTVVLSFHVLDFTSG
jgi:peroxiredoxin